MNRMIHGIVYIEYTTYTLVGVSDSNFLELHGF